VTVSGWTAAAGGAGAGGIPTAIRVGCTDGRSAGLREGEATRLGGQPGRVLDRGPL
jgi:hypothetical protein